MYLGNDFPNFFLSIGRVFGVEIPVTRRGKPNGSVLMTGQFKRMTRELENEIVKVLADMLVADYLAHPPTERRPDVPQHRPEQSTQKKPRQTKRRAGS